MLAVDTNVLVRLLVDDPGEAKEVASAREAVQSSDRVLIADVVLVETIWVLRGKKYRFQKNQYDVDFADCLILVKAERAHAELLTFDRDLGAIEGTRLLAAS